MRSYLTTFLTLSLAAALLFPAALSAQQGSSFERLNLWVRPGDTLVVTDTQGNSIHGKLESLSAAWLRLSTRSGVREFVQKDVVEIQKRKGDPLGDGAKRGFVIGVATGFLAALAVKGAKDEVPLAGAVGFGIYGAGIGVGIDALTKSNQTIYRAPGPSSPVRVHAAPLLSNDRKGVAMSLSF
jgi:hypothetical protein